MTAVATRADAGTWTVEVRADDRCLDSLAADWDDLYRRCAAATPFQSHAWLASWWRHYGRPGRLRVFLVRHDGRLVAAAALMRVRRWGCPALTPVGGGLSDFTDVLVDDASAGTAARHLVRALLRQRDWRVLDFPEVRPGAAAESARAAWRGRNWRAPASRCLELPATPVEQLVRDLPSHARKTVRRRLNQLDRLGMDVRAAGPDEADRAVADLVRLHTVQWQERGGNPEHRRPRFARHLAEAVRGMLDAGQAVLLEYRLDGRHVASNLVVVGPGVAGGYLYGAEPSLRDQVDIATLLVTTTMPVAHVRGCATMSMLRGAEAYKNRWRPDEAPNTRLLLARGASPRAWLYATAALARRRAVDVAKARLPWLRRFAARVVRGRS
jgi:CelD/BcsL family acetyltransferase involved in cellulose biosynthesis